MDLAYRYWLPKFLAHEFVALRFVPQKALERAASLRITPVPDVITRLFMLFKGIDPDTANANEGSWAQARTRVTDDPRWWTQVVGIGEADLADVGLFRVLEWRHGS